VRRRLERRDTVILQHVQKGGFAGIVQAKEQEFGMLVKEA
jgi:hypothetical protein